MSYDSPLLFYTKPGCKLCDEALEHLEPLSREAGLQIQRINIEEAGGEIYYRYRYRIPVISLDGEELAEGRVDGDALRVIWKEFFNGPGTP